MKPIVRYALARDVGPTRMYLATRMGSNLMETTFPLDAKRWDSMIEIQDWIDALPTRETLAQRNVKLGPADLSHREEFDGRGYRVVTLRIEVTVLDPALEPVGAAS